MAGCCPRCKREYGVSIARTEACSEPICTLVAHAGRYLGKYGQLPSFVAPIEDKTKREGGDETEAKKKTRNITPWPQEELERELDRRLIELIAWVDPNKPDVFDTLKGKVFMNSSNKDEFIGNWLAWVFDAQQTGHYIAEENKTPAVMARVRGVVDAAWFGLLAHKDLEHLRVETVIANAKRRLDEAEQSIRAGGIPPEKFVESGPAGIARFDPIDHLRLHEEEVATILARATDLVRQRQILLDVDAEGLRPLFTAARDLYRRYLTTATDLLSPTPARARVIAFLASQMFIDALKDTLDSSVGEQRSERIRSSFGRLSNPDPVTGRSPLPWIAEELVDGLTNVHNEVRYARYEEFRSALTQVLSERIAKLSIERGSGSVEELMNLVVRPFVATPAGAIGTHMEIEEMREIVRDAILMYAKAAPKAVKIISKPAKKSSKYRKEFVEAVVERIKLEAAGGESGWKTIKDKDNTAMVAWLENAALPREVAKAVGIPDERYKKTILSKASFLGAKIHAAVKKFSKDERKALAAKTAEERERLKEQKAAERRAKAEAEKMAREQERKKRREERSELASRILDQIMDWPEKQMNLFLSKPNDIPPESRRVIEVYRTVAAEGAGRSAFHERLNVAAAGAPVLPSDTKLGLEPHNLAWAKLELSALGDERRTNAVRAVISRMNIDVARRETLSLGLPDPDVYDSYMDAMAKINKVDRRSLDYMHERPALDPERPDAIARFMYKSRTQQRTRLLQDMPIELAQQSRGSDKEAQLAQLTLIARESLPIVEEMVKELEFSPANRFDADRALVELLDDLDAVLAELDDGKISSNRIEGAFLEVGRDNLQGFMDKLLVRWKRFDSQIASAITNRDASSLAAHKPRYTAIYPPSTLASARGREVVEKIKSAYEALRRAKETSEPGVASAIMNAINKDKQAEERYMRATLEVQEAERKRREAEKVAREDGVNLPPAPAPAPTALAKKRIAPTLVSVPVTPNLPGARPSLPVVAVAAPPQPPERQPERASSDIEDDDNDAPPPPAESPFKSSDPEKEHRDKLVAAFDADAKDELEDESVDLDYELGSQDTDDEEDEEGEGDDDEASGAEGRDTPMTEARPKSLADRVAQKKGAKVLKKKKKSGSSLLERARARAKHEEESSLEGWLVSDSDSNPPPEMTEEEARAFFAQVKGRAQTLTREPISSDLIDFNM